jgi:hypothetical protein
MTDDLRLTPRTAEVLRTALCGLAEHIRADVDDLGDRPVVLGEHRRLAALDRLPQACWTQDARWRRQLAATAEDLADRLDVGLGAGLAPGPAGVRLSRPRCTAEETVLELALEDAEDAVNDEELAPSVESLPEQDSDYGWDDVDAFLFTGRDLPSLHALAPEAVVDGFEPALWFTPFERSV